MDAARSGGKHTLVSSGSSVSATAAMRPAQGRWIILFLMSAMYLICYMDRSNIAVAQPEIAKAFGLDKTSMGLVLSAFTWAYAIGQIPAGWLGDHFGPKKVLAGIMSWWSLAAMMTGAAAGLVSLFSARLLLGLGEAGAFPVASRGMQPWFPRSERGLIQGTTHFFSRLAIAVTPFVAGSILLSLGWRAIFYIFGALGVIWSSVFLLYYRNSPQEHRSSNAAAGLQPSAAGRPAVPWRRILGSSNMWSIALAYGCFFFGTNFYLTWYPTYLREHRHLTLQALGIIGSVPLFAGMAGDVIGGALSDLTFKRTGRARFARSAVAAPGFLLSGIFLIPAAMTHSAWTSVLCLAASFFFLEFVIGPAWAVPMDVGGPFSGTVTGVMNMAGALAASLTPLIFGHYFAQGSWTAPFLITSCVMFLGALTWIFLIRPDRSVAEPPSEVG